MNKLNWQITLSTVLVIFTFTGAAAASDWSEAAQVTHDLRPCVTYRAKLDGDFVVVQATLTPGWHTFAMDNKVRAEEKLAGKPSLGIDAPTEIKLGQGLEAIAPWYQTPPKDFSKPELQWFTWIYDSQAVFVSKARHSGSGPAQITIKGQACTDKLCKQVDVALALPLAGAKAGANLAEVDLKTLVKVR